MQTIKSLTISTLALLVLAGCNPQSPANQSGEQAPAATEASATSSAIPADDINLVFHVISGPTYDAATDSVRYKIQATNNGKTTLASEGQFPVNIGVVIQDADGTLANPPANQDFARISLPAPLAPGQQVTLPVSFNAAPTLGGIVVIDGVQEAVSWFSGYGKPVLTLGSFTKCKGSEKLCGADGVEIPASSDITTNTIAD